MAAIAQLAKANCGLSVRFPNIHYTVEKTATVRFDSETGVTPCLRKHTLRLLSTSVSYPINDHY